MSKKCSYPNKLPGIMYILPYIFIQNIIIFIQNIIILYETINGTNFSYRKMILCDNSNYTCVIHPLPEGGGRIDKQNNHNTTGNLRFLRVCFDFIVPSNII